MGSLRLACRPNCWPLLHVEIVRTGETIGVIRIVDLFNPVQLLIQERSSYLHGSSCLSAQLVHDFSGQVVRSWIILSQSVGIRIHLHVFDISTNVY